ncbi:thioesterase family protein [Angustibacter sp. McL0619]|uniref:thioesterase family protein n=1 Tax=Angustibacter sp. McL0619 TaxID=3415676 RepID=UPI003CFADCBC
MAESFFTHAGGDRFASTEATVGPWSDQLMHGGPPAALLVYRSEQCAQAAAGGTIWRAARTVVDFLGPVPVGDVEVNTAVARQGRSAILVDAELRTAGRSTMRARTWLVRLDPTAARTPSTPRTPPIVTPEQAQPFEAWTFGYARHLQWRSVEGDPDAPGPSSAWARTRVPLVDAQPMSGLQHACLFADSANGIGAEVSWDDWAFLNIDLTVHLLREPVDSWLLLAARSELDPDAAGLSASTLHDREGLVGHGAQTLVVRHR